MLKSEKVIHIDILVKLAEVKAVFSIASLSFEGDPPASLFHIGLLLTTLQIGMPSHKSSQSSTQMRAM
jgi:hypothetical protein